MKDVTGERWWGCIMYLIPLYCILKMITRCCIFLWLKIKVCHLFFKKNEVKLTIYTNRHRMICQGLTYAQLHWKCLASYTVKDFINKTSTLRNMVNFFKKLFFKFVCACICLSLYMCTWVPVPQGLRHEDLLKLEL